MRAEVGDGKIPEDGERQKEAWDYGRVQHGSWERVGRDPGLGLGVRASGALSLQRKKGPEYRRQRYPFSPRKNVYPVCLDPASALGPRISSAQCRDSGERRLGCCQGSPQYQFPC